MPYFWCKWAVKENSIQTPGTYKVQNAHGKWHELGMIESASQSSLEGWIRTRPSYLELITFSYQPNGEIDLDRWPGCKLIRLVESEEATNEKAIPPTTEIELWAALKELVELEDIRLLGKRITGRSREWVLGHAESRREEVWKRARELVHQHRKAK